MYYERVFSLLQENKIRYAVAGGVALVLHGIVRFTADLDLIVKLDSDNLQGFIQVMKELGYKPRNPVPAEDLLDPVKRESWKQEKNMTVFSFIQESRPMDFVDVFIDEQLPFEEIEKDVVLLSAKGITIPVVSVRNLIQLKKAAGRSQDLADIEALEALGRTEEKE